MNILVTGGTGFIGRWVVGRLLKDGQKVWVIDNLANSSLDNLNEYAGDENLQRVKIMDLKNRASLQELFRENAFDLCYHLAASINVQDSIDDPETTFNNDTMATFYLLEECRKQKVKMVFMSTCMVYARANDEQGIDELSPIKPASPYAGAKIAAENMVLSYFFAYGLPVVVVRPFNTYGPFQKTGGEGGVVAIFIHNKLKGEPLNIYGDGTQSRDLLYVEDCADFVVEAGYSDQLNGEIVNAGTGKDITINRLAELISDGQVPIHHIPHIHPQSEIQKLLCNFQMAERKLSWTPKVPIEEGIKQTEQWIQSALHRKEPFQS
ncbi:NAD-dependent epimerase/dehydratase family protein [Paenibacillus sp. LMG 31459]|uniref:NAD-dependent epimerase/dehydratase family protein n=1 Tax=Paenibacillus phytohabitans TaxID=2654978 RepID=A0ABX1YWE9_9BACL|nr:NAD-dependent epimerase/dehydratase family protein [Paenibacillus phytohabitans]NOU84050.1 NAD-dependent epimerase/dehydratase family protein [Paenibacillus phytohabitans]